MKKPFFILGFAAFLAMAGGAEAGQRCTRDYAPVCARAGHGVRTFDNPNCARAEHARILHRGRCRKDIEPVLPDRYGPAACPMVQDPVCGERDGSRLTFPNRCFAERSGAEVVGWGACWY